MQKTAFYNVKGILSQRKRYRFAIQNKAFDSKWIPPVERKRPCLHNNS